MLDPAEMEVNPGLRYLAKICLNSLWGRFALRNHLTKSALVRNAEGLADYLDNDNIEISMIEPLTENCWLIVYKDKQMNIVENCKSFFFKKLIINIFRRFQPYYCPPHNCLCALSSSPAFVDVE